MIIYELQKAPAKSVTQLAHRLDKLRPSVSRSLKPLRKEALVVYEGREWRITPSGQQEAARAAEQLQEAGARIQRSIAARLSTSFSSFEAFNSLNILTSELDTTLTQFSAGLSVIQQAGDLNINFLSDALGSLAQAQIRTSSLMKNALGIGIPLGVSTVFEGFNQSIASAIGDGFALRNLSSTRIPELGIAQLGQFPPVSVHLPGISASLESMTKEWPAEIGVANALNSDRQAAITLLAPPVSVAAYSRSLRQWLEEDSPVSPPVEYPIPDHHALIRADLAAINPRLANMHSGAWSALNKRGPDCLRHAAVSMRELLRVLFKHLVPDEELREEGKTRIKARMRKVLCDSKSGARFATHMSLGLDGMFDKLNAYTHGDESDRIALQGLLMATDGMLIFVLQHIRRSSK